MNEQQRKAMVLALQLVSNLRTHSWTVADEQLVITAIKEALAQPEHDLYTDEAQPKQEPVAYIKTAELDELKHCNGMSLWAENAAIHTDDSISKQLLPSGHVPVYTTPPQRKPLTDAQINQIAGEYGAGGWICDFARAIEAAHSIKE